MTPSCLLQCPRLLYVLSDLHLTTTYFLQPCTIFSLRCRCSDAPGACYVYCTLRLPRAHTFLQVRHSLTHSLQSVARLAGTALFICSVYCNLCGCCSAAVLYLVAFAVKYFLCLAFAVRCCYYCYTNATPTHSTFVFRRCPLWRLALLRHR